MRLIELEAAIKTACDAVEHYPSDWAVIETAMRALPVVEERKHGHWIFTNARYYGLDCALYYYKCSICGELVLKDIKYGVGNYCLHCGAVMDEVI